MSRKKTDISKLDLSKIGGRVAYLRAIKNLNMDDFASHIGLTKGNISNIENHKYEPSFKSIVEMCKHFNVNPNWLILNSGEPFEVGKQLDETTLDLLRIIQKFEDKERAKEFNKILKKIEELDKTKFYEALGWIKNELKNIESERQIQIGYDRRQGERRQRDAEYNSKEDPESIPGGKDRRSGRDRRKAAGGDH